MRLEHWPPRWKQRGKTIYYRTKAQERERFGGSHWYRLGHTEEEAFAEWYRIQSGVVVPRSINDAINIYMSEWQSLSEKSQREYARAINLHLRPVFGHMRPQDLMPSDIVLFMKTRPRTAANRERAVLSNIMQICVDRGVLTRNPVKETRRNKENSRDRYVTDDEVNAFLDHCTPFLRAYVGLKLLTGLRQGQLLALKVSDWNGHSLTVPPAKGGRAAIYSGDGLEAAIEACMRVRPKIRSVYLIATRRGQQYTGSGFRALWQYAMWKYTEAGGQRFTEHDLRAKVASDSEDLATAQSRLQHQSPGTTSKVYRRAPVRVEVLSR